MRDIDCILLLEDNEGDQFLIENILQEAGLKKNLIICDNITDYRKHIENYSPDVILADFHVPGFDSFDALQICKTHDAFTPFIFVTGSVSSEMAKDTIISAADAYVLKDNLNDLPEVLKTLWVNSLNYRNMKTEYLKLTELSRKFDRLRNKLKALIQKPLDP